MALLGIRNYPDQVLKTKAQPVTVFDEELQKLIDDMVETMYAAPGVGLAAPQVGVSRQLVVIDVSGREADGEKHPLIVLVNPELVSATGEVESEEGCLSLPGLTATLQRAENVVVRALDREGRKTVEIETGGLLAIVLQHEMDHLAGKLILDRASPLKRRFYQKKLKKSSAR
jgi:peptide deformylase